MTHAAVINTIPNTLASDTPTTCMPYPTTALGRRATHLTPAPLHSKLTRIVTLFEDTHTLKRLAVTVRQPQVDALKELQRRAGARVSLSQVVRTVLDYGIPAVQAQLRAASVPAAAPGDQDTK